MIQPGLLELIWKDISREIPGKRHLIGKKIQANGKPIDIFSAVDSESQLHFLIAPVPHTTDNFKKISLRGLSVSIQEWDIKDYGSGTYLDLVCSIPDINGRRPFSKFCEDVLTELNKESNVEIAVYRTFLRWKRFWDAPYDDYVNESWIKGLFGELNFIYQLLKQNKPEIISAWQGPSGKGHDFQMNNIAVEVKATMTSPAILNVNSIKQLDYSLFERLWINLYTIKTTDTTNNITSIVYKIESLLNPYPDKLDIFWSKLSLSGYKIYLESLYKTFNYVISKTDWFPVNEQFPKIISSDFLSPPDRRIKSIFYTIELSGLQPEKSKQPINKSMDIMLSD